MVRFIVIFISLIKLSYFLENFKCNFLCGGVDEVIVVVSLCFYYSYWVWVVGC